MYNLWKPNVHQRNPRRLQMTDQLTPGQSLTWEQVRNLPDGAEIVMNNSLLPRGIVFRIDGDQSRNLAYKRLCIQGSIWHSAVLVSLPSEPSPGEGYRWLVRDVDTVEPLDEYFDDTTELWEPTNPGFIGWLYTTDFAKMRRRIEPQAELPVWVITCDRCGTTYKNNERHACVAKAEPAPRVASEIEKEAASVFITSSALAMIEWAKKVYECERDVWLSEAIARLDTYRRAESYARSIGAIE